MNLSRTKGLGVIATVSALALALSACGSDNTSTNTATGSPAVSDMATGSATDAGTSSAATVDLSGSFAGAGASSQENAMNAWRSEFQNQYPNVTISYDPVGSGGGREQFLAGAISFGGSDRALKEEELTQSQSVCGPNGAMNLPVYISPIAVIFNLGDIKTLNLKPEVIAGLFAGTITNWNDPAIAADNPGVTLPDLAVTPVHRSDDSGTTSNFTDYLHAVAPDVWTWDAAGTWPFEGGQSDQGTSGVVNLVTGGQGTIGYADASKAGDLGTAAVGVGSSFVEYSAEAAAAIVDESPRVDDTSTTNLAIKLDRTSEADGVYPIVLVSYGMVCTQYSDQSTADFIKEFFTYIASDEGQTVAHQAAGNAPISDTLREEITTALAEITVG